MKDAEHGLRLTRSLLGNLGRLPTRQDRETLTERLRAAQTALTGRVRELRGLVEWKQWANVGVQAALCQRLEALAAREEEDDEAFAAREFRQIMNEWRQASDVSREEGNDVWRRFKAAHDVLHPRFEAHRAAQDTVRRENLAKKVALCEEAERLADSTDWIKVAQRMTELQEEWKQVGAGDPQGGARGLESLPGHVRPFLPAAPAGSGGAQGALGEERPVEGGALRQGGSAGRGVRHRGRQGGGQAVAGGMEDGGAGAALALRGLVAALPGRVRPGLHTRARGGGRPLRRAHPGAGGGVRAPRGRSRRIRARARPAMPSRRPISQRRSRRSGPSGAEWSRYPGPRNGV